MDASLQIIIFLFLDIFFLDVLGDEVSPVVDDDGVDAVAADSELVLVNLDLYLVGEDVIIVAVVEDVVDIPFKPFLSILEVPAVEDDEEDDDDNEEDDTGALAPPRRGGQAEPYWSTMFCCEEGEDEEDGAEVVGDGVEGAHDAVGDSGTREHEEADPLPGYQYRRVCLLPSWLMDVT